MCRKDKDCKWESGEVVEVITGLIWAELQVVIKVSLGHDKLSESAGQQAIPQETPWEWMMRWNYDKGG